MEGFEKLTFVIGVVFFILIVIFVIIAVVTENNKSKSTVNKEYSISIYDLNGKLVMSFVAFNVDGNDNTIFYEDRDGKQRIVYVPNDTIVTIEEV